MGLRLGPGRDKMTIATCGVGVGVGKDETTIAMCGAGVGQSGKWVS